MSLAIKYESVDDASMRLRNTLVLYKDQPVIITGIAAGTEKDEILRVLFKELPYTGGGNGDEGPFARAAALADDAAKRKYISSKHFDIAPFKLGYVNHPKYGAFYVSRLPNRIQKQGFCAENYRGLTNQGQPVTWHTFVGCKESVAMIMGDYPSFERAKGLIGKSPSVAFCRDFSLMKDEVLPELIFLYHKGAKVGYVSETGVTLGEKFKCLRESLAEQKVRVV